MKTIEFRVICDYANNNYQIKANNEHHMYEKYNCLCKSVSDVMLKTFQITRDLRLSGEKAVFHFE